MSHHVERVALHRFDVSHRTQWRNVELVTSDGLIGTGECSDIRPRELAEPSLTALLPVIFEFTVGDDLWDLDSRMTASLGTADDPTVRFGRRMLVGAVIAALCDIYAQIANQPLTVWMGGTPRPTVELYANINRAPIERRSHEFATTAAAAVDAGFRRIKLAPFDGPALDGADLLATGISHIRAVREAIGYGPAVLIDVHKKLDDDDLLPAVRAMEELQVGWIEDAVDAENHAALESLAATTDIPLAGGELLTDPTDIARVCSEGWLDYLLLDPKYVGGPLRFQQILESVEGVTLTLHDPTGPIATATSAHLTCLAGDAGPLEYAFGEGFDRNALITPAESMDGDLLSVPNGPGIGHRLSTTGAGRHRHSRVWARDDREGTK